MDFSAEHIIHELDPVYEARMPSPLGIITITASQNGLRGISLGKGKGQESEMPLLQQAVNQLGEFFEGGRREFFLPMDVQGTPFQLQVWQALGDIPFGETISYMQIAEKLGGEKVSRAVGAAVGANPLAIILPCHRVIGSKGDLTGFAWGLPRKRWLLDFEAWHSGKLLFPPQDIKI